MLMSDESTHPLVDGILRPLSEDSPAGRDLRLDVTPQSPYFRLRDARSDARAEERQADNDPAATDSGSRHWKTVHDLAVAVLTSDSKDIEIAAWLTESLVRSEGLAGLEAGARILCGLVETFWHAGLFPAVDEDGLESRLAPVAGLNGQGGSGTLLQPLRRIVLFERNDGTPVTFWQYEQSEDVAGIGDATRRNQRLAAGVTALADLEADARGVGQTTFAKIGRDVTRAIDAWRALDLALTKVAGAEAPSTGRIAELLDKLQRVAERYVETVAASEAEVSVALTKQVGAEAAAPSQAPAGPHMDREGLLADITRIAALFRANEPNSPLGYTLDEAVRRARLGWPDLLRELVPDASARAGFLSSLGIRPAVD
jgi:type VI secretion system protein ImpA